MTSSATSSAADAIKSKESAIEALGVAYASRDDAPAFRALFEELVTAVGEGAQGEDGEDRARVDRTRDESEDTTDYRWSCVESTSSGRARSDGRF